ncbi:MAG: hypothetical protein ABIQ64_01320 [Candidatus Saccharimonadales bacterium]
MTKKKTYSRANFKFGVLFAIGLLLIVVIAISAKAYITASSEKNGFNSLQSDMKILQTKFNAIDTGWEYSEFCRSEGGVYQGNIPNWCGINITNTTHDFSNKELERVGEYSTLINELGSFKIVKQIGKDRADSVYAVYDYENLSNSNCSISTLKAIDPKTSSTSMTFGCSHDAREFYFNNLD